MKHLFLAVSAVLALTSVLVYHSFPDQASDVPVVYWMTDPNPARVEQIRLFGKWLEDNGHPMMEIRIDAANNALQKKIIQGVSGVGGDVLDMHSGPQTWYFQSLGILEDLTDVAQEMGFGPDATYESVIPELAVLGRQYGYPCNAGAFSLWVNKKTFRKYGLEPPPRTWDFETFERIGKQFVQAANPPGERPTVFFCNRLLTSVMWRSLGLSIFNETCTRSIIDDERYVRVLRLLHKWIYEDHLLPSAADVASFDTESGYGGSQMFLFNSGNYAMFPMGRWALIRLRDFEDVELGLSNLPCDEFENAKLVARCAGIYKGSRKKEYAKYFLAYLASEEYNRQIVRDADALPPNPAYTGIEEFLRPPDHPREWGLHEILAEDMETIAIGGSYSPFVLPLTVDRIIREAEDAVQASRDTPEEAARRVGELINAEIDRTLEEYPALKKLYKHLMEAQEEIERLRAAGEKVPLELIQNSFHQRYYVSKGWSDPPGEAGGRP